MTNGANEPRAIVQFAFDIGDRVWHHRHGLEGMVEQIAMNAEGTRRYYVEYVTAQGRIAHDWVSENKLTLMPPRPLIEPPADLEPEPAPEPEPEPPTDSPSPAGEASDDEVEVEVDDQEHAAADPDGDPSSPPNPSHAEGDDVPVESEDDSPAA